MGFHQKDMSKFHCALQDATHIIWLPPLRQPVQEKCDDYLDVQILYRNRGVVITLDTIEGSKHKYDDKDKEWCGYTEVYFE
jgi:hypothetical protein